MERKKRKKRVSNALTLLIMLIVACYGLITDRPNFISFAGFILTSHIFSEVFLNKGLTDV